MARAYAYGLGAVLLGSTLDRHGFSSTEVGIVLAAVLTGTVITSSLARSFSDKIGRRRAYLALYAGPRHSPGWCLRFATTLLPLVLVALVGALSTEVVESGPFTSLEQAMLAGELEHRRPGRGFGVGYARWPPADGRPRRPHRRRRRRREPAAVVPRLRSGLADRHRVRVAAEPIGRSSSPPAGARARARRGSRTWLIWRLSELLLSTRSSVGFTVQSFIAYYLATRFHASIATIGVVFFVVGLLQTASFLAAGRLGDRFGLLNTMVSGASAVEPVPHRHQLRAEPADAPSPCMFARTLLSQMDVPTRQAYVMALVPPHQRVAAAATTNTARYLVRPVGPLLAGASQNIALGLPFLIAGSIKAVYDLGVYSWFRKVPLRDEREPDRRASVFRLPGVGIAPPIASANSS